MHSLSRIVHCDINSYFAIMTQQHHPSLRGKPVGIVKEQGRTCIIAASKEAKLRGVKTGMRLQEARLLCPEIVTSPAEFDLYLEGTKKLHRLFSSLVPQVEIFSLDEAFLHLTDCKRIYPDLQAFGQALQIKVKQVLGEWVTCNVGIGRTRFMAKMASETSCKGSVSEVTPENLQQYLLTTGFDDVCGIGFRLSRRLHELGVSNLLMLHLLPDDVLQAEFGPFWGRELRRMSNGEEPAFLARLASPNQHMKGVSRSITGWDLCDSERTIKRVIYNLTAEICAKARKMELTGRYVAIFLNGEDQYWGRHLTLKHFTNQTHEVFGYVYEWLYRSWRRDFKIIRYRVSLAMLVPEHQVTEEWLPQWHAYASLYRAIDEINRTYGEHTVYGATMHAESMIGEEVTGYLGDMDYQFHYR